MTEKELFDLYIKLQKDLTPDMSIEVGAHEASYSKTMAGLEIEAFAFEASPYVYNRFKDGLSGIYYINKAVSDKLGTVQFQMQTRTDYDKSGNNTIKLRNEDTEYEYIDIQSTTLDHYFIDDIKYGKNIALWIDVEGANEDVLLGAEKLLELVSSIHIEVEEIEFWKNQWLHDDVTKYLAGYGFEELSSANVDIHGHQKNIIYIKRP
jgi:FkbM family methyltransferase